MIQQNLIKDYGKPIEWSVASLFTHDRFVWELLYLCKALNVEVPINSVYGSIPCLFQGGRLPTRDAKLEDVKKILERYDDLGISCRLTFSNYNLTENDFNEERSNTLLEMLNSLSKVKHGVIVSNDRLVEYIRDKYPNLYLVSSLVKPALEKCLGNDNVGYYNSLFDTYDYVSINPEKINHNDFLMKLSNLDRVIFCANNRCLPNCTFCWEHLDLINRVSIKESRCESTEEEINLIGALVYKCKRTHKEYPLAGNQLSQSDIEDLVRRGVKQFSLEGRDYDGQCFIRDIGDYVFNYHLYSRLAYSIMEGAI